MTQPTRRYARSFELEGMLDVRLETGVFLFDGRWSLIPGLLTTVVNGIFNRVRPLCNMVSGDTNGLRNRKPTLNSRRTA
jgi:hypothetical protein